MRKLLVFMSILICLTLFIGACSPIPTSVPTAFVQPAKTESPKPVLTEKAVQPTIAAPVKYAEAPMLNELVKAGKLPLVDQRLPETPLVVKPWDGIGKYGGTIRVGSINPTTYLDGWWVTSYEGVMRLAPNLSDITPNVAKSWKLSGDAKSLSIELMKGIKWSSGKPFNADDILFWWNDVILNTDLTPKVPAVWTSGGKPMSVVKVDDYNVRFEFSQPYPNILRELAHENGSQPVFYPAHYLKDFHSKYAVKEDLDKKISTAGFKSWVELFLSVTSMSMQRPLKVGIPTLQPFVLKETSAQTIIFERNPYYWKVDPAGNQLPYVDKVQISVLSSAEVYNAKVAAGEVDFAAHQTDLANYSLYVENAKKGEYRVLLWPTVQTYYVQPNLTTKDLELRKIFQDVRFRQALSLAIDRNEINEVLSFGKATPDQITVMPGSKFYKSEYASSFASFDIKKSNQLLDDMGLNKKDTQGYRLRLDGKRVQWSLTLLQVGSYVPMAELLVDQWREIGLDVKIETVAQELGVQRSQANEIDMNIWRASGLTDQMFLGWPGWYLPGSGQAGGASASGFPWFKWLSTGGKEGEEPPDTVKKLNDTYKKLLQSIDPDEQAKLGLELTKSQAENLWSIGFMSFPPRPIIVKNYLKNVADKEGIVGFDTGVYYAFHSEVMYIDK